MQNLNRCEINLNWKGTDACFVFYCPCGYEGADDADGTPADSDKKDSPDNHRDGYFMQEFQCAGCGQWWHLPNQLIARPGRFFRDDGRYGCDPCDYHFDVMKQ